MSHDGRFMTTIAPMAPPKGSIYNARTIRLFSVRVLEL
jgi:hypothetical protein